MDEDTEVISSPFYLRDDTEPDKSMSIWTKLGLGVILLVAVVVSFVMPFYVAFRLGMV
jgi:hypothetical protein